MPVSVMSSPGIQILTKSSISSTSSILGTLPLLSCKIILINKYITRISRYSILHFMSIKDMSNVLDI